MQKIKTKKRCRDGVTCVVLCTLPSIYLVCVLFGTAIPTSFYIFGKCFSYFKHPSHLSLMLGLFLEVTLHVLSLPDPVSTMEPSSTVEPVPTETTGFQPNSKSETQGLVIGIVVIGEYM